jgi:hypothetical protein
MTLSFAGDGSARFLWNLPGPQAMAISAQTWQLHRSFLKSSECCKSFHRLHEVVIQFRGNCDLASNTVVFSTEKVKHLFDERVRQKSARVVNQGISIFHSTTTLKTRA